MQLLASHLLLMKSIYLLLLTLVVFMTPATLMAEVSLCVKKSLKISNQKLAGAKLFKSSSAACPKGFIKVFGASTESELLGLIRQGDGAGSGLDADLLDGLSSEAFASAADVSAISSKLQIAETALQSTQQNVTNLTSRTNSVESEINILENRVDTASSGIEQLDIEIGSATTSISSLGTRMNVVEGRPNPARVVHVATSGGNFNNLSSAVASLQSPSAANPYMILVAPGTYILSAQLVVPSGVTIKGSGKHSTIITGDISSASAHTSAVMRLSNGARLQDLKVINTASTEDNFGAAVSATTITESNPDIITNLDTEIDSVWLLAAGSGSRTNYALHNSSASMIVRNSILEARDGTNRNYAISVFTQTAPAASKTYVFNSDLIAGASLQSSIGAFVDSFTGTQSLEMRNSRIRSEGTGVLVQSASGSTDISETSIKATNIGVRVEADGGTTTRIRNSYIDSADNLNLVSGGAVCAFISQPDGSTFNEACE